MTFGERGRFLSGQILAAQGEDTKCPDRFWHMPWGVPGVVSPEVARSSLLFELASFDAMLGHVAEQLPSFACHTLGDVRG